MRLFLMIFCFSLLCGCAMLDRLAPSRYDEHGNRIPGSREPTIITKTVAENIPYGDLVLNVVLLFAAGYERFRAQKMERGLKATLLAGKQVANDPQMKKMWEEVQNSYFRQSHENAGVTSLIKSMKAKLPSV